MRAGTGTGEVECEVKLRAVNDKPGTEAEEEEEEEEEKEEEEEEIKATEAGFQKIRPVLLYLLWSFKCSVGYCELLQVLI
jgi:hypothetical protein